MTKAYHTALLQPFLALSVASAAACTMDDGGLSSDGGSVSNDGGGTDSSAPGDSDAADTPDASIPSDFDLEAYSVASSLVTLSYVPADLSGITYNPDSDTFYMIRNNATRIWQVDTSYNLIRSISPSSSFGDTEDIVYLGNDEYAIVTEEGVLYIGTIPSTGDVTIRPEDFQAITFASNGGNQGPEGVAYDAATQTFYIVKEENPRKLYSFVRPAPGVTNVTSTEPFDAQLLPMPRLMQDMSGVLFNPATRRLIILSHRDHRAVDIDLSGTVFGILDFPRAQHEGIAFDGDGNLHIVGEPNRYSVYSAP